MAEETPMERMHGRKRPSQPSIERQIEELNRAGWKKIKGTLWEAPGGGYFRGPHGAWLEIAKDGK